MTFRVSFPDPFRLFVSSRGGATRKRGLTGARARFVPFAWLLTCRWCNGSARQIDALKTKNSRKICVFRKIVVSLRQNSESMKKEHKYKSEESEARERAHQFGQPGANPQGNPGAAVDVRKFLRWAETEATEAELQAYANDKTNPFFKRRMCELLLNKLRDVRDVSEMLNQTHGQPKQVIEQTNLPTVEIILE